MQEHLKAITDYDSEFTEEFAQSCLDAASDKANKLQKRVYLMYDIGCIYFETEDEITSSDFITWVDPD